MDRTRMQTGWRRALNKLLARKPEQKVVLPRITLEEAAEMAATQQRIASRKKRLTIHSDLAGREFHLLLAWEKLPSFVTDDVPRYECLCACGKPCEADASALLSGRKKHCGCKTRERRRVRAWRLKQKLARLGRKRSLWRRFYGLKAA